jgi:exodeoxyribonuclease VII small subunit
MAPRKLSVPASQPESDWHYETSVREVNHIIQQIEAGDLDLAEVFEQFSQAVAQLNQCDAFLNQQQGQLSLLIETLDTDR